MHYYVVGVNGSGKTSLLHALSAKTGISVVHGTTELMNYLGIPDDYDALRALNQDQVLVEWGKTALHLLETYGKRPFFVDTHIMNLTKGAVIPRDGNWIGAYDALILVTAQPAVILERIARDVKKDRALFPDGLSDKEKLHMLTRYQEQTEQLFHKLAAQYNLPSLIIDNSSSLEHGVQVFMKSPLATN